MAGIYDQLITRVDAAGLIPPPDVVQIQQEINQSSIATTLFRQVPMSAAQSKTNIIDSLPYAYWVNGDTGLKQTTKVSWAGKMLTAEELAVIVPVPESVIADASVDIWAQIRPLIAGAFSAKLDAATVFGVQRPASFAQAIVPGAAAATPTQAVVNADAVAGTEDALALLEALDVNVGSILARATLRGAIRTTLQGLGGASSLSPAPNDLFGYSLQYPPGTLAWPANLVSIMGDWSAAILGVRQDITYKFLDQAVITDDLGAVIFNLPQQDSIALRAVARYGFQTADSLHVAADGSLGKSYPFATAATA